MEKPPLLHSRLVRGCLEMVVLTKIFHWQTFRHSIHEASDTFYDDLNEKMDLMIEECMGIDGRFALEPTTSVRMGNMTLSKYKKKLKAFRDLLQSMDDSWTGSRRKYRGLLNTRDDLVGIIDQYQYRLTLL